MRLNWLPTSTVIQGAFLGGCAHNRARMLPVWAWALVASVVFTVLLVLMISACRRPRARRVASVASLAGRPPPVRFVLALRIEASAELGSADGLYERAEGDFARVVALSGGRRAAAAGDCLLAWFDEPVDAVLKALDELRRVLDVYADRSGLALAIEDVDVGASVDALVLHRAEQLALAAQHMQILVALDVAMALAGPGLLVRAIGRLNGRPVWQICEPAQAMPGRRRLRAADVRYVSSWQWRERPEVDFLADASCSSSNDAPDLALRSSPHGSTTILDAPALAEALSGAQLSSSLSPAPSRAALPPLVPPVVGASRSATASTCTTPATVPLHPTHSEELRH